MTKEIMVQRIMQCTPEHLQFILDTIHSWWWAKEFDDKLARKAETVQDIITVLSRPKYIQDAEKHEDQTGEDYFESMFGI